MAYFKTYGYLCERCDHRWLPNSLTAAEDPKVCPKCKSRYWNKPRMTPARGNPSWRKDNAKEAVA